MNKFLRNSLMAGVFAFGLAACGDDVTVTQPPTPPPVPNITSFTVAPASVTLTAGQVVQASYNLQLAPGLTGTVDYLSGTGTVASIDATGKITALVPGTTLITATATSGGQTSIATIGVTVLAAPVVNAITSFTVAPTTVSMVAGTTTQASYNLQLLPGLSGAVSWSPANSSVATVSASGMITAVAPGNTIITATATSAGQTQTAQIGVTVTSVVPAAVSISSVTQGLLTLPVNASNVNGQIEINLNFNPGGQAIDSIVSYIGTIRAAKQAYSVGATPAAGIISMSVNTANYIKNVNQAGVATPGATKVDFDNGPTTINAIVFPKDTTGSTAGNCANAPTGVPAVCSSNTFSIILTNVDSWASDVTKPTNLMISNAFSAAAGQTFWGGPGSAGVVSATLYPVIYTAGRTVTSVTWGIGGCSTVMQTALPFTRTFGYAGATPLAQTPCTSYQWTGGARDNVFVSAAIDNASNVYGPFAGLIPNTVVFNSTPDSIRLDYVGPTVTTPVIARTRPAVTGWVNAAFSFVPTGSTDNAAVGTDSLSRGYFYNAPNCGAATAVSFDGTGNTIPECATNLIGGTPGLGSPGTAPYRAYLTEADLLGNVGTSSQTQTFGVDKTAPLIRWGIAGVSTGGAYLASLTIADSTFRASKPVPAAGVPSGSAAGNYWRAEFIDERSGFYNNGIPDGLVPVASAQTHALSTAGHFNNAGLCMTASAAPIGATFVTSPACTLVYVATGAGGFLRNDGWMGGAQVDVPLLESYYGYRSTVSDQAGNTSSTTLLNRTLVNTRSPFSTGLGILGTITSAGFNIGATFADSAEITRASLQLRYPALSGLTAAADNDSARYTRTSVGTAFDDVITSPFTGLLNPSTGAPPYVRHMEAVTAAAWDGLADPAPSNVNVAPVNTKPTATTAWAWNHGSTLSGGPAPTPSLDIALPALNVQNGTTFNIFNFGADGIAGGVGVNADNVTNPLRHFRVIPTVATTDQFGSTTPLRAQAVSGNSNPNAPFVRVDFYRYNVAGDFWSYLGSSTTPVVRDQGTNRSYVWSLPTAYVADWTGAAQGVVASGNKIAAVGVSAAGDGIVAGVIMP